jgi:putative ABC transport system substrate-binding protein
MRKNSEQLAVSKKRRLLSTLLFTICLLLTIFLPAVSTEAQEAAHIPKIGFLGVRPDDSKGTFELLKRELRTLGYIDGKNISLLYRNAENKLERLPALVDELIRLKVDILVVAATNEARAAKNATKTIPIVALNAGRSVESGLIDSVSHPGGNLTGFTPNPSGLSGKRLELLKETFPKLSRVAVLWDPNAPTGESTWKEVQSSATALGLQLFSMQVSRAEKLDGAFKDAVKAGSSALTVNLSPFINSHQRRIHKLAAENRLPAMYPRTEFVQSGGLMSYGADRSEGFRRTAVMIDKILKGTKPADIPVEQPTKFELVINLKTAKQIGLTIPANVLARADRVIK